MLGETEEEDQWKNLRALGVRRFGQPLGMMAAQGRKKYRRNSCELVQTISSESCPKTMG